MRTEDLLRAMSEVDDLILRSDRKKSVSWKPLLSMAAVFLLLGALGVLTLGLRSKHQTLQVGLFYENRDEGLESYSRAAKEAVPACFGAYEPEYAYYTSSQEEREQQIRTAVEDGCRVLLFDGREDRQHIIRSAAQYPKTMFLALGISNGELQKEELPENIICVDYRPEIAGYLAGYTAIKEGYTHLGYYYDAELRAYLAYGSGYLQGIQAAAKELGIENKVQVRVSGTLKPRHQTLSPEADRQRIEKWYASGTQMILACGSLSCEAATVAAEEEEGDVILVGGFQGEDGTSPNYGVGIAQILDSILRDSFDQRTVGEMPYYTLYDPDGTWGFRNVSEEEFGALRDSLSNGTRPCETYKTDLLSYTIEIMGEDG